MPRRPSPKRPPPRQSPRLSGLARLVPVLHGSLHGLRNLGIGLALIGSVSFLPESLVQTWPEHGQRAIQITRDIRTLLLDVVRDTTAGVGSWLSDLDGVDIHALGRVVAEQVPEWLPRDLWPFDLPGASNTDQTGIAPSFSAARTALYDTVYSGHRVTFYCGCGYDRDGRTDLDGCGLRTLDGSSRAQRVEAEHVFPASQFGNFRRCWREPAAFSKCRGDDGNTLSGRACCERVDPTFVTAHNDLHNLVPAVGAINAARSDFNWSELRSGQRLGDCAIRFDPILRRVQPPDAVRGEIARTMFYMRDTYGFRLSRQDEKLYAVWNNADPPDAWEIERNRRIRRLQGKGNRYVEDYRTL
ncbi:endonuclease [Thiocapsa marina]|uniref:Deoxyribonuclease I n=1 Tax=Thiocapsa marina 5811 TaxID=768671 RepID=F9UA27_9GAMM|nr:endonuclease [Thiocapsa marina]EGV18975.1 Deoxyribonuclease I [Thiocapsa marina 5811]